MEVILVVLAALFYAAVLAIAVANRAVPRHLHGPSVADIESRLERELTTLGVRSLRS